MNGDGDRLLDHLPEDLAEQLGRDVPLSEVVSAAPYDVDAGGMYTEGYLVLTPERLGRFERSDGRWNAQWISIDKIGQASLVDGLGMKLLRLTRDGELLAEYRFTLRHAKSAGRIHRQIERVIGADGQAGQDEPFRPDEKKLRCDKCGRVIPAWSETCPACMNRRKILFRILDFGRPYIGRAVAAFVVALAMTAMGVAQPWLIKPLINLGFGAAEGASPNYDIVLTCVGAIAGLMVLRLGGQILQLRLSLGFGTLVSRSIRRKVYSHLHKLSLSFFATRQTGALVSRITQDTERLWRFVSSTVIEIIVAFLTLVAVGICLFVMDWRLACFTLLPIPLMTFLLIVFHKRLRRAFRQMWFRWEQMTAVVADALPGVRVIKAFSQEKREIARFEDRSNALFDEERRYISGARSVFAPLMLFSSGLGSIIVWLVGGWWLCQGQTSLGTLMAFQGFLTMFLRPIHEIAHMDEMFNRAATSAHRIFEVLDTEPAIFSRTGATKAGDIRGRIELQNVSFSYDGIRKVLHDVCFTVEPGQMIGLAGPSGGGKTTLVNLICRFYDVLEGRILVDGVDVRDYDVADLRRRIGVVLQEPFLFHGTVAENISYSKPDATIAEIIAAARAANANDFILDFPDAYDTIVGERGQSLSGGERQRISIARAILNDPAVLILDEATSSVDTETEKLIQEALEHLTADRTTVAIAHRLSTLRRADRLIVLDKGVVVEEGTHEELEDKPDGLYARLLSMQREAQLSVGLAGGRAAGEAKVEVKQPRPPGRGHQ